MGSPRAGSRLPLLRLGVTAVAEAASRVRPGVGVRTGVVHGRTSSVHSRDRIRRRVRGASVASAGVEVGDFRESGAANGLTRFVIAHDVRMDTAVQRERKAARAVRSPTAGNRGLAARYLETGHTERVVLRAKDDVPDRVFRTRRIWRAGLLGAHATLRVAYGVVTLAVPVAGIGEPAVRLRGPQAALGRPAARRVSVGAACLEARAGRAALDVARVDGLVSEDAFPTDEEAAAGTRTSDVWIWDADSAWRIPTRTRRTAPRAVARSPSHVAARGRDASSHTLKTVTAGAGLLFAQLTRCDGSVRRSHAHARRDGAAPVRATRPRSSPPAVAFARHFCSRQTPVVFRNVNPAVRHGSGRVGLRVVALGIVAGDAAGPDVRHQARKQRHPCDASPNVHYLVSPDSTSVISSEPAACSPVCVCPWPYRWSVPYRTRPLTTRSTSP